MTFEEWWINFVNNLGEIEPPYTNKEIAEEAWQEAIVSQNESKNAVVAHCPHCGLTFVEEYPQASECAGWPSEQEVWDWAAQVAKGYADDSKESDLIMDTSNMLYRWLHSRIPAPSIVLPEKRHRMGPFGSTYEAYSDGWNKCIDEVMRLNKSEKK